VVIKNFLVANNIEVAHITKLLLEEHLDPRLCCIVDAGINKTLHNFRLPYSYKAGSDRIKKPIRGALGNLSSVIGPAMAMLQCWTPLPSPLGTLKGQFGMV